MVIAVATNKGGTGKTTTAAALAQAAAYKGRSALAIDLDPQGQLSFALAADTSRPGSYELLTGGADPGELIQRTPQNIDVIPASWNLSTLTSATGSARRLQRAIEPIKANYDFIVVDTPTAGELQYNALQAADGLIIPLWADIFGVQALYQITDTAQQIKQTNPDLLFMGFVLTQYSGQTNLSKHIKDTITEQAAALDVDYLGAIRKAVAAQEAIAFQESLYEYAPKSNPAQDYMNLYLNIEKKMK